MCVHDNDEQKEETNASWQGWRDLTVEAPSSGPLPADWPSVADVKSLLADAARHWDAQSLQPPSEHGVLLPAGYVQEDETVDEALVRFTEGWRENLRNLKLRDQDDLYPTAEEDLQQFLNTGKSGPHSLPLRLQILILDKDGVYGAHAHSTIEMEYTLRGGLGEARLVSQDPNKPFGIFRGPWEWNADGTTLKGPNFKEFDENHVNLPKEAKWKDMEVVSVSKYLFNEVGSIHKSYTTPEPGAFFIIWGGKHAVISPDEEGSEIPNSQLLSSLLEPR